MIDDNPYQSPNESTVVDPRERRWLNGVDSVVAVQRLLQRKIVVNRPLQVTIEYFARGLRDRILVDGKTVVSMIPIMWFHKRFEFEIPCAEGDLPAVVNLKIGRFLKLKHFELVINGVVVYQEQDGVTIRSDNA